jgi:hypothetical protein
MTVAFVQVGDLEPDFKSIRPKHGNLFPRLSSKQALWASGRAVAGPNPAPATINDERLADAGTASPFRLPRLHPGIPCLRNSFY